MFANRRFLALAAVTAVLLVPQAARSACPTDCSHFTVEFPPQVTFPSMIRIVQASATGEIDPAGEFTVTVRDMANFPVAGVPVRLDFTDCLGLQFCGMTGSPCAEMDPAFYPRWMQDVTDATGIVRMRIRGGYTFPAGTPEPLTWRSKLLVCGWLVGSPVVSVFDLAMMDGVNGSDLSFFVTDLAQHGYYSRTDYDGNGFLNSGDLSVWANIMGRRSSDKGCGVH